MTWEIGDVLIQEVLDHKIYTDKKKVELISKIKKLIVETNWTYGGNK